MLNYPCREYIGNNYLCDKSDKTEHGFRPMRKKTAILSIAKDLSAKKRKICA